MGGVELPLSARLPTYFLLNYSARRIARALARSRKTHLILHLMQFQRHARPTYAGDALAYNVSILSLEHSCLQTHTNDINPSPSVKTMCLDWSSALHHPRASQGKAAPTPHSVLSEARPELPRARQCQHTDARAAHPASSSSSSGSVLWWRAVAAV